MLSPAERHRSKSLKTRWQKTGDICNTLMIHVTLWIDFLQVLEHVLSEFNFTWSCTSSSQSSSCMMCSKGLNKASLKWKCGSSAQLVSTSVRTSWMKETAFWDTWRSLWHAAWKQKKHLLCLQWTLFFTWVIFILKIKSWKGEEAQT